jgi:hypothetical protein
MTIPAPPFSLVTVANELGQTVAGFSMERTDIRGLAQVSFTPGTPWAMSSLAGKSCENFQLNIGFDGSFTYGCNQGVFGATGPTTVFGVNLEKIALLASDQFEFQVAGTWAQNVFKYLYLRNTPTIAGTAVATILDTAAASVFIQTGTSTYWGWGVGAAAAVAAWRGLVGSNVSFQVTR